MRQTSFWVVGSVEQRVRAQILPDHDLGKLKVRDFPGWRENPVVGRGGEVAPESNPGQTVCLHLFTIRNFAASVIEKSDNQYQDM